MSKTHPTQTGYPPESSAAAPAAKPPLLGLNLAELTAILKEAGFPAFRAKQLHHWLYRIGSRDFAEMLNLAKPFRQWLGEQFAVGLPEVAAVREAADGSRKILFRLGDNETVEAVLMPERDWWTVCVSSQVGCALGCAFCVTGLGGWRRDLAAHEILGQIIEAGRLVPDGEILRNVVFMGMGEPMLNLDAVIRAARILVDPDAMAFAARRVTISTAGVVPGIERLGAEDLGVNIAISLNSVSDDLRDRLMPINRKYSIESLLAACRAFPLRNRRRITFEYVLLGGVNDSEAEARELAHLLHAMPGKINLIPWNPDPRLGFERPSEESVARFQQILLSKHFTACVRNSKGLDVGAACGQLASHIAGAVPPTGAAPSPSRDA